ncbi:MAG: hypothetical protein K2J77_04870 [Oscillospiraceae bacterium]|nr:hypothetical protein [Oscillospiraceae bacterium]
MDTNKIVIRNIIRVIGIIAGAVAGFASLIFRRLDSAGDAIYILCTVARIGAIALFVCAVAFMIFDIMTKAYPISIGAIGLVLAIVAFVGSFLIAPACSQAAMEAYVIKHSAGITSYAQVTAMAEKLGTQVAIGSWMIAAGGIFFASYSGGCMKQGK